jgi:hypothetical protein
VDYGREGGGVRARTCPGSQTVQWAVDTVARMSKQPVALEVGPVEDEIRAPAALVFQMLAAIGQGAQRPGERAEILERDGDALVCDFWTLVSLPFGRTRSVRTREAVRLVAPDRIEYEHLDGPVRGMRESISVVPLGDRHSRLLYRGTYKSTGLVAGLAFRLVSRRAVERAVGSHFADLRTRAEARAARSRLFQSAPESGSGAEPPPAACAPPGVTHTLISPGAAFGGPAVVVEHAGGREAVMSGDRCA